MRLQPRPGRHAGRRRAPWARQAAAACPGVIPSSGDVWETSLSFPPPPAQFPPPLSPDLTKTEEIVGASSIPRVAIDVAEPTQVVPRVQHQALHRAAEDGVPGAHLVAEFVLAPSSEPWKIDVKFISVQPPQLS